MFKVSVPLSGGNLLSKVPSGFWLDRGSLVDGTVIYRVKNQNNDYIGFVRLDYVRKVSTLEVEEDTENGKCFWQAWGMKNPDFNVFRIFYGVLYLPEGEIKFEFDNLPSVNRSKVLESIVKYRSCKYSYFVEFCYGAWTPQSSLKTIKSAMILPDGSLDAAEIGKTFLLGDFENKDSMK